MVGGWDEGIEWRRHGGGVVSSTNHPLLNFYNFCKYHRHRRSVFSPSSFFDILKFTIGFPTNCWQILNWSQFQSVLPLFSVFLFAIWDFWWQILLLHAEEDLSFVCVLNEVGYCKTKFCDDLFFCSFNNLQKDWWELGFVCW